MAKSYEQYIEELNCAYREFYCDGVCKHFDECSKGMEYPKIKCDYATRVGKNYGKDGYPKVLMVGKESINFHSEPEEPLYILDGASQQHYPKTLYTLAMILKREQPKSWAREDLRQYEELFTHYALTNYFKCAFSDDPDKVNGLQHNSSMENNCFRLLLKELDVLEPDLLVIQGKFTTQSFWTALDQTYSKGVRIWGNKTAQSDTISLYQHKRNGRAFYIIYSYHPAGKGGWWMKTLDDLKTAIVKFREEFDMK